jgi:hypothetical protein
MKQRQPALSRLSGLVKKQKKRKSFPLSFRSPPSSYIKSSTPLLNKTQSQTTTTYFIIFSRINKHLHKKKKRTPLKTRK